MKSEQNKKNVSKKAKTSGGMCSSSRDCCHLRGCLATYYHVSGELWEFGECGCSGDNWT
ncbi:hypothetical protein [Lentibacillus cibarius]|uniref:hypothetical protein n=1 Tax=Lentibacillus cibarius TaxID=2583219 RepID=UPI0013EB99C1|nr:hypothetical protein [Lentibacillus cibarius]